MRLRSGLVRSSLKAWGGSLALHAPRFRLSSTLTTSLLPMVNSLQAVFAQAKQEFDLPQIVVVGSQSSGKSR
jgi:hypothetical protein